MPVGSLSVSDDNVSLCGIGRLHLFCLEFQYPPRSYLGIGAQRPVDIVIRDRLIR